MVEFSSFEDASFVTHCGKFHADEVMATVVLLELMKLYKRGSISDDDLGELANKFSNDSFNLCRVAAIWDDWNVNDKFIYDIGGRDYDHHQVDRNGKRENGIFYSSVGLIWKSFGMLLCRNIFPDSEDSAERLWLAIDRKLIQAIDAGDNGQFPEITNGLPIINLDELIGEFNPVWCESQSLESQNRCFLKAVEFADGIFNRLFKCEFAKVSVISAVNDAIEKSNDGIMILDKYIPWEEYLMGRDDPKAKGIMFAILPSNRDEGCYTVMSPRDELGNSRMKLPKAWRGKRNEELEDYVEGGTFCHPNGFMAVADSLEHAISMARLAIMDSESDSDSDSEEAIAS